MKIVWLGGSTFRIQIEGRILVIEPDGAPRDIEPAELRSGADTLVDLDSADLPHFDAESWRPRRRTRLIDEPQGDEGLDLRRLSSRAIVCDTRDEGMMVLAETSVPPQWGRWADAAVVVLAGAGRACAAAGTALLDIARPKLIVLAVPAEEVDAAFAALAPQLAGSGLVVADAGLAVEA
ncbi:hypothetical protein [Pelagibacterium montanilacus]|uniref:hypothetical protein n=1 Tax=Pelagibacterium montanilacus TaxID=2185280 RepID=UPI000F8F5D49|nr:hypothetical protein [Pelagibacterium montanilacus]